MESIGKNGILIRSLPWRRLIIPLILFFSGYIIFIIPTVTALTIDELLRLIWPNYISYGLAGVGAIWFYLEFVIGWYNSLRERRERRFSDVDDRLRGLEQVYEAEKILEALRDLKESQQVLDYDRLEGLVKESSRLKAEDRELRFKSFDKYFDSLSSILEKRAQTADEKASILLDKGTVYSRGGIFFFLITIIVWQVVFIFDDFKTQHIYGIASCSLLFIFIEFLSAWFLRQYRHYVDTSTYLLKVKSIFDRYMLVYLVISGAPGNEIKYASLADMLSDDIKWPESYLMKNPDLNFAKEALETITHFAKAVKSEAKNSSGKKSD